MKRNLYFLFTLFFIHISAGLFAQDIVRGRVMDTENNEPVPGATVVELDANDRVVKGTITDFNGNFAIKIDAEYEALITQRLILEPTISAEYNSKDLR